MKTPGRIIQYSLLLVCFATMPAGFNCASARRITAMMEEGDAHFKAGRYEQALELYGKVVESSPKNKKAQLKRDDAGARLRDWALSLAAEAKRSDEAGFPATAAVLYKKSFLVTGDSSMGSRSLTLRNSIRAKLVFRVDFKLKKTGTEYPDFFHYYYRLDEALSSLPGWRRSAILRDIVSPHITITIEAGTPLIRKMENVINRTKRYISGTYETPNELYGSILRQLETENKSYSDSKWEEDKWQKEISYYYNKSLQTGSDGKKDGLIEERLSAARRNLGYVQQKRNGIQNNINSLNSRLAYTPKTIKNNQYSDYPYTETEHIIHATVPLNISVLRNGTIYNYFNGEKSAEYKDISHPAHPVAGIQEDPLNLPNETSLKHEIISIIAAAATSTMHVESNYYFSELKNKALTETSPERKTESLIACAIAHPVNIDAEWKEIIAPLVVKVGIAGNLGSGLLD